MFSGMDHVGIAVKNLDKSIEIYRDVLGFKLLDTQTLIDRKVKVAFLSGGGQTNLELLEPLGQDSAIAKFLEARGEGIHHFAMKVEDIAAKLEDFRKKGVTLIDEVPRIGAEGKKIAFVHPRSTNGVLLELCEQAR